MNGFQSAMSMDAFVGLGRQSIAYVKRQIVGGREVFAVHAADGAHLVNFPNRATADAALRQHDLEPFSVH